MARRLVPGLALDRFANLRRAAIPMGFAIGLADARGDVAEPVARRPAHHRRIGVDELLGAEFPQSRIGLVVHRPCDLADAFDAFEIALVGHAEQSLSEKALPRRQPALASQVVLVLLRGGLS